MQAQRINNSSTTARYRLTFDYPQLINVVELIDKLEPMNYGGRVVERGEEYLIVDIYID